MTNYRTEFPDFDLLPAIPSNWTDVSWRNDACPSFEAGRLRISIDYADPDSRDCAEGPRFAVSDDAAEGGSETVFQSDDWMAVVDFVAREA